MISNQNIEFIKSHGHKVEAQGSRLLASYDCVSAKGDYFVSWDDVTDFDTAKTRQWLGY